MKWVDWRHHEPRELPSRPEVPPYLLEDVATVSFAVESFGASPSLHMVGILVASSLYINKTKLSSGCSPMFTTRVFEDEAACDEYVGFLVRLVCLGSTGGVTGHVESNGELDGRESLFTLVPLTGFPLEKEI
jgi:hypothetical protein